MIYSLSFTKEQFIALKSLLYKNFTSYKGTHEIELRFGKLNDTKFISNVNPDKFRLLRDKIKNDTEITNTVYTQDTVYSKKNVRKIVSSSHTTYEKKDKTKFDISVVSGFESSAKIKDQTAIRFGHAIEQTIEQKEYDSIHKQESTRVRDRTTFHFTDFQLDFTLVNSDNKVEYEIEAELSPHFTKILLKEGDKAFIKFVN